MVTKKTLLTKQEILDSDILSEYWNYLISIKEIVIKELSTHIPDSEIITKITSMNNFFSEDGIPGGHNYPELEEIYFHLKNHTSAVRICISFTNTTRPSLQLIKDRLQPEYFAPNREELYTNLFILSELTLKTIVEWLKDGTLDNFGKEHFEEN